MKRILYVRSAPYDLVLNLYNIQEIGMAKAFCCQGYNVDIIVFCKKPQKQCVIFEHNGYQVQWIEKSRYRWFRWGINLKICKGNFLNQYDYVIGSEYMQLQTFLLSRKTKNMYIYNGSYYNLFMFKWTSPIYDLLFTKKLNANVKQVFTKSIIAESFLKEKGYGHLTTVGVGLDISRFEASSEIEPETKALVDYMLENKCILYVGNLSERKNYPFLLEVYEQVLKYDPDIKFVVIGKSVVSPYYKMVGVKDEYYEKNCMKKTAQKVKNGIYRIEKVSNSQLRYIYPLAKAFLLPSKLEIFGMVLLEAMYLKAPIITSKNGGSMTLIYGKETGQMIEEFDKDRWCCAVMKYLNDTEYARTVVQNAHELIKKEYTWEAITNKMINIMDRS